MRWNLISQTTEVLAIHAALLRTGDILFFSGDEHDKGQSERGQIFHTRLFNCTSFRVSIVSSPGSDVFCAGQTMLADGSVMAVGGTEAFEDDVGGIHGEAHHFAGLRDSWIYNPDSRRWTRTAYLEPQWGSTIGGGRWYPTLITLPDARVLGISGHPSSSDFRPEHNNHSPELYSGSPSPWGKWELYGDSAWRSIDYYPRMHVMPDGLLFCLSTVDGRSKAFHPKGGFWQDMSPPPNPNYNGIDVSSVLLPLSPRDGYRARVLACNHQQPLLFDWNSKTWSATGARQLAGQPRRIDACNVILPTAEIFVCGGTNGAGGNKADANGVQEAELYKPDGGAGTWVTLPKAQVVRNYHSVALLMPDGRVWTAGSNKNSGRSYDPPGSDNRELRVELFEPDYFSAPNRPVIEKAPGHVPCAQWFDIETPQASSITKVVMIRNGSITHAFNGDQRLIELEFKHKDATTLRALSPPNNNIAPPGDYMIFILAGAIPSVAKFVSVRQGYDMEGHIILFEHANFHGAHKHLFRAESNLNAGDDNFFNDRVSSIAVLKGNWEFFRHAGFNDRYPVVLGPGLYRFVGDIQIANDDMSSLRPTDAAPTVQGRPVAGYVVLFEHAFFHGAHKHVFQQEDNLNAADDNFFNDRVSSIAVLQGHWHFYRHAGFGDPYKTPGTNPPEELLLGPALYPRVTDAGIANDDISSLRPDTDEHHEIIGSPIEGHVMLFEHANFHGAHKHVFRAEANLNAGDDNFFNDRVSSIAVLKTWWAFFRHSNFGEPYPNLLGGAGTIYPWVEENGISNDDMSSLMPWPETR